MREIKFRAWNSKELKYSDDYYDLATFFECHDEHLMQYTGLKDKNGKEIYEGDIFKTANNYLGKVIWQNGGFDGVIIDKDWPRVESIGYAVDAEIEIIGNVYENPELLER